MKRFLGGQLRKYSHKLLNNQLLSRQIINKQAKFNFNTNNFLQVGQIPQQLEYDRPFNMSVLSNGIRVCSEFWPSPLTTIAVFICVGSRNETAKTSGSAHFLEHLHFKGTHKRDRLKLELDVENMGGQLNAFTSRENTAYTMTVFRDNSEKALEILGDMLLNSQYNEKELEAERETIFRELLETQKLYLETLVEYSHLISFPDHQMGKPILGMIQNIYDIDQKMIKDYHSQYYHADNIIVVGSGNIEHKYLEELSQKYFGHCKKAADEQKQQNNEINNKPIFKNNFEFVESNLLEDPPENINVGIFSEAPSQLDQDYYEFLLLQRILGEKPQNKLEAQLYTKSNINTFQQQVANISTINEQKSIYIPYKDTGLFGNYYFGDRNNLKDFIQLSQRLYPDILSKVTQQEIERAKLKLYNELLQIESGNDITQSIGNQIQYFKRRVFRSEIAKRISFFTTKDLQEIAKKWLFNKGLAITVWGHNVEEVKNIYEKSLKKQQ